MLPAIPSQLKRPASRTPTEVAIEETTGLLRASGLSGEADVRRYPWEMRYSRDEYLRLLSTYSENVNLDEPRRAQFLECVGEVVNEFGGSVTRPYLSVLFATRKPERAKPAP